VIQPFEIKHQRVLVTALNWGMGHTARCIGLVRTLQEQSNEVYFAGNEEQHRIIRSYFPSVILVPLADYPFRFTLRHTFSRALLQSFWSLYQHVRSERKAISKIVEYYSIDVLISDHRYGAVHKSIPSIFITHQVHLPVNGFWRIGNAIHQRLMKKFDAIWIPDFHDSRLSGKLSANPPLGLPVVYIGLLSRFNVNTDQFNSDRVVMVLSGPDDYAVEFAKQRITKEMIANRLTVIGRKAVIERLQGDFTVDFQCSTDWNTCDAIVQSAGTIVAACGYSTLMDIQFLRCRAQLFPTPGQLEQQYLAQLHGVNWILGHNEIEENSHS